MPELDDELKAEQKRIQNILEREENPKEKAKNQDLSRIQKESWKAFKKPLPLPHIFKLKALFGSADALILAIRHSKNHYLKSPAAYLYAVAKRPESIDRFQKEANS